MDEILIFLSLAFLFFQLYMSLCPGKAIQLWHFSLQDYHHWTNP